MYKSIIIVGLVCAFALVCAAKVDESPEVKEGMKSTFQNAMNFWGNGAKKAVNAVKQVAQPGKLKDIIYSSYTQGLRAVGGGKPATNEQYRQHNYVPAAPVKNRPEIRVTSNTLTAEEAKKRFVPQPDLQYSTERMSIP